MHRNPDGPGLVGDRPCDRLTNPPRRIGAELVAPLVLELVDRPHQADIALLNQVQEVQTMVQVPLRDADHEAQIRADHLVLGAVEGADVALQLSNNLLQLGGVHADSDLELLEGALRTFDRRPYAINCIGRQAAACARGMSRHQSACR